MLTMDASSVACHLFTFKEGALSALAHDLELRVARLTLEIEEQRELRATFDATSLVVLHALKAGQPTAQLSAGDRRKIEQTLSRDVLDVRRHPEIRFHGTAEAAGTTGQRFTITGELTLHGQRRPLQLQAAAQAGRMVAEATLHQPDFGIKPYSAMLGALKVRPDVKVRISTPWPLPS